VSGVVSAVVISLGLPPKNIVEVVFTGPHS
jgi:hypothetical protein